MRKYIPTRVIREVADEAIEMLENGSAKFSCTALRHAAVNRLVRNPDWYAQVDAIMQSYSRFYGQDPNRCWDIMDLVQEEFGIAGVEALRVRMIDHWARRIINSEETLTYG